MKKILYIILSGKGGVGKTTTAINLVEALGALNITPLYLLLEVDGQYGFVATPTAKRINYDEGAINAGSRELDVIAHCLKKPGDVAVLDCGANTARGFVQWAMDCAFFDFAVAERVEIRVLIVGGSGDQDTARIWAGLHKVAGLQPKWYLLTANYTGGNFDVYAELVKACAATVVELPTVPSLVYAEARGSGRSFAQLAKSDADVFMRARFARQARAFAERLNPLLKTLA